MSPTTIAESGPSTFTCFPNLPPELRNQIWNQALLEKDRPALFSYRSGCWNPLYLTQSDKGYIPNTDNILLEFRGSLLKPVPVEVPLYFVNHEARRAALNWAERNGTKIPAKMPPLEKSQRHIFGRLFDKDNDMLYVALNNFADFLIEPYHRMAEPDLFGRIVDPGPSLRYIAVPEALLKRTPSALGEIFEWFRYIEVILIIVNADHEVGGPHRWEIERRNGKGLFYDDEYGCFDWDHGENICDQDIYGRIEQATKQLAAFIAGNRITTLCSIHPVFAVRR
ncbi:hypothetical protein VE03_02635 [Pseudogymnoascus sp. 23342-1-I1]|nr:hypothetical protein VE03_02635 [Pseudogymnoascus sp. 23342-1-I1]